MTNDCSIDHSLTHKITFISMKSLLKVSLLAFTLCALFTACSSDSNSNTNGDWEWVKTYGSIAGTTWTPESTNSTRSMSLSDEIITFYENGIEVNEYEYTLFESDTLINDGIVRKYITYNQNTRWYDEDGDTLVLRDLCADCYDDHYTK